ncbi:Protein kinase-like domain containing protein [Klebsormidium nitens]|uniref:non-specific serine/threonine protein kinase n=1 Tax=Klebsormidium nitens TaxID=105231 RepID=A0A1Y1IU36_KLENI|nr:Protein kinase-like domain containing protein [Klebsormidium nitens]|eukprot:GAQ92861.1 Protein kinase-like domain containing protein [Klebsormidium nitens]
MLRTHRPATLADETFEQLPVGLLSPILAQVEEDCAYADPLAEDTDFAVMLSEEMSGTFADEDSRREKFCDMLSKEFFMPLNRATVGLGVTDGTAMLPVGVASAMAVNTEIKLEVGQGGGDPRLQNATYAAHNASLQYGSLGRVSYCPALLIELAGPNMSLSGFALGQYACCDQLSQMVSLLRQPKSEIAIGAARAIFAIRRAWPALQEYYQKLAETLKDYWRQSETPMPNQQLEFPYPNLFKPDGGDSTQSLRYLKRLTTYTFEAESMSKKVFVKYCKRYSREAHLVVQEAGHAPRLLCVQLLPGRWVMVVMEYLETAVTWSDSMVKPIEQLTAAVRVMHDAGFVHGDLRSPNVLVQDEKVHLVDFEWAGKEGHVSYPLFMNRATEMWPEGATDGQFIRKTHDAEWVRRLRAGDG